MSKRIPGFDFDPTPGSVGGSVWAHAPFINDAEIGRSRAVVPIINRIHVDGSHKIGPGMGSLAKKAFFADYPGFVFNVCFAVGDFSLFYRPGSYGDPYSPWFNVFVGYYQLDAPKSDWTRPFGYESGDPHGAIAFADILRLGKADWNYFSNYMYGVPLDCISPFNNIDLASTPCQHLGREVIGSRSWDLVRVDNVEVGSAYESDAPGARRLVNNTLLTPVWRRTFGLPHPRPDFPQSFIPTSMRALMYLSFSEDKDHYYTAIFGGTVNQSFPDALNERFLDLQLKAGREVITRNYPNLGFPPPGLSL
jgi:hypothetical protein